LSRRKNAARKAVVELTWRAIENIREIERYSIEHWGRRAANSYIEAIADALDRLRDKPEILRLEPDIFPGLYFYRVNKHFLVCDFHDAAVIVLTVVHTSMDLPTRLQELEPRLLAESQILQARLRSRTKRD
jgi:plasmid stabilization system protein ParE